MKAHQLLEAMGFCGCGQPEDAARYMRDAMQLIYDRTASNGEMPFAEFQARELTIHGSTGTATFFYYWLTLVELAEHGGSVPGWLTEMGEEFLEQLRTADYDD